MPRFFIESIVADNEEICLTGSEMHHLVHVYRAKPGMHVLLFDKSSLEYKAQVIEIAKKSVKLQIIARRKLADAAPKIKIVVAQGLLKNKSWNILLQKSMELGLYRLLPMVSEYSTVGKRELQTSARNGRWQKIVIAAAKQCGRTSLLDIAEPQTFCQVATTATGYPLRLIAHNDIRLPSLKDTLARNQCRDLASILVMIGPEGGFSDQELELAKQQNAKAFCLGAATLRAETAALAIIANLNFYFE